MTAMAVRVRGRMMRAFDSPAAIEGSHMKHVNRQTMTYRPDPPLISTSAIGKSTWRDIRRDPKCQPRHKSCVANRTRSVSQTWSTVEPMHDGPASAALLDRRAAMRSPIQCVSFSLLIYPHFLLSRRHRFELVCFGFLNRLFLCWRSSPIPRKFLLDPLLPQACDWLALGHCTGTFSHANALLLVHFCFSRIINATLRFADHATYNFHVADHQHGHRQDPLLLTKNAHAQAQAHANALAQSHSLHHDSGPQPSWPGVLSEAPFFGDARTAQFLSSLDEPETFGQLPAFVRPLPHKIDDEDVRYLHAKGALAIPSISLQNALLQAYTEYVHPYMPLMDLHEFLGIVHHRDGLNGQTSLLLFQAVMFSATAFVDMKHLREAGYHTRKAARKAFFQKTRVIAPGDLSSIISRLICLHARSFFTTLTMSRTASCSSKHCCS